VKVDAQVTQVGPADIELAQMINEAKAKQWFPADPAAPTGPVNRRLEAGRQAPATGQVTDEYLRQALSGVSYL
jgi:hypothetical protein